SVAGSASWPNYGIIRRKQYGQPFPGGQSLKHSAFEDIVNGVGSLAGPLHGIEIASEPRHEGVGRVPRRNSCRPSMIDLYGPSNQRPRSNSLPGVSQMTQSWVIELGFAETPVSDVGSKFSIRMFIRWISRGIQVTASERIEIIRGKRSPL